MPMTDDVMEQLLNEAEGTALDFKRDQYPFVGANDADKGELLKDILALANSWRRTTAYILIGVEEVPGGRGNVIGVTEHLADHNLQQFVNSKTNRKLEFSYEAFPFEGQQVGIVTIPKQQRPFLLNAAYGGVKKQVVYTRQGSSTHEASVDEVARMAAADASEHWAQRELEEQRQAQRSHQELQRTLHEREHRPRVLCDFPTVHKVTYLRVKNHGNHPAKDITVTLDDPVQLPALSVLRHPIPVLAPDDDSLYFFLTASGKPPGNNFVLTVRYSDFEGRQFENEQRVSFDYMGSMDIGREGNDPLVAEVRKIRKFFTKET